MRRLRQSRSASGFTLLELMIVLAIITVFAGLGLSELSELLPRFRARQAAHRFASHLQEARQLAILENRETRVSVVDWDSDLSDASAWAGRWQIAVGNLSTNSTSFDVLPVEAGIETDSFTNEGTFDIGPGGNIEARYVGLDQPQVTDVTFSPRGWLANNNADFGGVGYMTFAFHNQKALAESGLVDSYEVRVYRGGMVRVEASLGVPYTNSSAGYDPTSSISSTAPSGGAH